MSRGGWRGGRGGGRGGMPPGVGFGYGQLSQTEWKEGINRIKAQSQTNGTLYPVRHFSFFGRKRHHVKYGLKLFASHWITSRSHISRVRQTMRA